MDIESYHHLTCFTPHTHTPSCPSPFPPHHTTFLFLHTPSSLLFCYPFCPSHTPLYLPLCLPLPAFCFVAFSFVFPTYTYVPCCAPFYLLHLVFLRFFRKERRDRFGMCAPTLHTPAPSFALPYYLHFPSLSLPTPHTPHTHITLTFASLHTRTLPTFAACCSILTLQRLFPLCLPTFPACLYHLPCSPCMVGDGRDKRQLPPFLAFPDTQTRPTHSHPHSNTLQQLALPSSLAMYLPFLPFATYLPCHHHHISTKPHCHLPHPLPSHAHKHLPNSFVWFSVSGWDRTIVVVLFWKMGTSRQDGL